MWGVSQRLCSQGRLLLSGSEEWGITITKVVRLSRCFIRVPSMWACAVLLVTATVICHVSSVNFWPPPLVNLSLSPYWENNSHVGMQVECSKRSRFCLTTNQLLHEPSNTCHDLGAREPCTETGGTLVLDPDAFRMGRLRTYCRPLDECEKNGGFTMAFDGKCFTLDDIIRMKLCPNSPKIVPHPFGGMECHLPIFQSKDKTPSSVEPRQCAMPSLRNERFWPWVSCNKLESECLRSGQIPFLNRCYYRLTGKPCPEGQWLVLDEAELIRGSLRVSCAYKGPCGPDAELFREDKSCHSREELLDICKEGHLVKTPGGDKSCSAYYTVIDVIGEEKKPGLCEVKFVSFQNFGGGVVYSGALGCGANNQGNCGREITSFNSSIELEKED